MSHTKGNWTVWTERNLIEIQCDERTPIITWLGFDESGRSYMERLANAKLIAIAPQLFDFVKAMAKAGDPQAKELINKLK